MNEDILRDLTWRGLLADCTHAQELSKRLAAGPTVLYAGFDPTADSLHVGNLVPLIALRRFQLQGHVPLALAGGATGLIGDPSGRTTERQLLTSDVLAHNVACINGQLARLLDFSPSLSNTALLLNNASWFAPITFLDFLRDVGKYFTVNNMMAKESVRSRMEDRDAGISFTEFSYMLLQAYDFYHLRQEYKCELQIGGSDQWGNITAGTDLCRKKLSTEVYGLTLPLITNSDGTKFGKSLAGAVWLDPARTSIYQFYQFWIRAKDEDVVRFLKFFTLLPQDEIEALEEAHRAKPELRQAHQALAREMTAMIHGEGAMRDALHASDVLFGGAVEGLAEPLLAELALEVPSVQLSREGLSGANTSGAGAGLSLIELLVKSKLCPSKGQARKDIEGGGIYVNNVREGNSARNVEFHEWLHHRYLLLRKGKRNYAMLILC